ncbi:MAG: hypothetical protein KF812_03895 [Fimbriimonadaceae bacterium]|nr:hypothetical protein [Fimbriimonadaceae bacterium]
MRSLILLATIGLAAAALPATITVTKPTEGDFLGRNNTVQFNIVNSNREATVVVTATFTANPAIQIRQERKFTPDGDGKISGSIPLNFSESSPQGAYTINVVATEPNNSYNTVPPINVTVDVRNPKIVDFNPIDGAFVSGIVPIRATLDEDNIKEWRVRVASADIPNNSGTTRDVEVMWDTSAILTDGPQSIELRVDDEATNSLVRSATVTVDRRPPTTTILAPANNSTIPPTASVAVVMTISDQFANSVDSTGIDVIIQTLDGRFFGRVSRRSARQDGSRVVWTGRLRSNRVLPNQFKIVVRTVDKAGNTGTVQEVLVRLSGRGRR